jgi:elongation factor P--beta-lysine ligase
MNYLDKSAAETKKKEVLSIDNALTQARNALKKCSGGSAGMDLVAVLKDLRREDLADEDKMIAGH